MIATIDIKCNVAHPEFPLQTLTTFKGSSSSIRIIDVPKKIGDWCITKVFVDITNPDNTIITKEATLTKGVWIATIKASEVSGKVDKGFVIKAMGKDEHNQDVDYVLGIGDVLVLDYDSSTISEDEKYSLHFYPIRPTTLSIGDVWYDEANKTFKVNTKNGLVDVKVGESITKSEIQNMIESEVDLAASQLITLNENTYFKKTDAENIYNKAQVDGIVESLGCVYVEKNKNIDMQVYDEFSATTYTTSYQMDKIVKDGKNIYYPPKECVLTPDYKTTQNWLSIGNNEIFYTKPFVFDAKNQIMYNMPIEYARNQQIQKFEVWYDCRYGEPEELKFMFSFVTKDGEPLVYKQGYLNVLRFTLAKELSVFLCDIEYYK